MAPREELLRYAVRDLAEGGRPADVIEMLVKNGMDPREADQVVRQLTGHIHGERTRGGLGQIVLGVVLAGIGVGATLLSMASGDGGGVVFYGLVVVGLFSIGRGLMQMLG